MVKKGSKTKKRSLNVQAVAKDVINQVRKGQKVKLGATILKHGFTKSMSESPTKITKTKSYKEVMDPFIKKMITLRDNLAEEMASERRKRTFKKEKLLFMSTTMKNTIHDIQLLTGGRTDNFGLDELRNNIADLIKDVKEK